MFYCVDAETGERWSLGTTVKDEARQIVGVGVLGRHTLLDRFLQQIFKRLFLVQRAGFPPGHQPIEQEGLSCAE